MVVKLQVDTPSPQLLENSTGILIIFSLHSPLVEQRRIPIVNLKMSLIEFHKVKRFPEILSRRTSNILNKSQNVTFSTRPPTFGFSFHLKSQLLSFDVWIGSFHIYSDQSNSFLDKVKIMRWRG